MAVHLSFSIILSGIGTMIGGCMTNNMADVVIGCGQLFIPFVGWVWSWVWGFLMIIGRNE